MQGDYGVENFDISIGGKLDQDHHLATLHVDEDQNGTHLQVEARTLHHDVKGRFGAGKVTLRAAPAGTGIIAGGPMRAIFETLGIKDIVAKSVGTSNPHNMIKATFKALEQLNSPRMVATRRGKKVGELLGRRDGEQAAAAPAEATA